MGGDNRLRLHEVIDYVGGLFRSGGERITDVHHHKSRTVVILHDQLLLGSNASVTGQVDHQAVGEPEHVARGWSDTGANTRGSQILCQWPGEERRRYAIAVHSRHGRNCHAANLTLATEPNQQRVCRITAGIFQLGGKEGGHFATRNNF